MRRYTSASVAERVEQGGLALEGEEQQVDHAEGRAVSGRGSGARWGRATIEMTLPSIARWKVSATMRPPTPVSRPALNSASRRM